MKIKLGQKVRCLVSGLEGIANARAEYLNGCVQYSVQPQVTKDGKKPNGWWIDETQLVVIDEKSVLEVKTPSGGGPMTRSSF